ncbi:cAMP-dependent protein kinase inhibitor gamma isoform X1 [Mustela nigripes]|uniref:cAMP-dependent protein kinase inhibitor gamma isoform X1 n=1 Tax=Mustela lutreola TaxID=9666 RepID=UPI0027975AC4|nr:cAMP-dependent protein kinase inhibitor gamma isoform X1 [Mustela lutreola]XP_059263054.1 cAMP-dependent protein kinase inhibitor gamma isoform X1 [Mustela nigripes]
MARTRPRAAGAVKALFLHLTCIPLAARYVSTSDVQKVKASFPDLSKRISTLITQQRKIGRDASRKKKLNQKDRQRRAPQTRQPAASPRAVMGPPRLESDLAHGGWKRDLLSLPGLGALALAWQPLL